MKRRLFARELLTEAFIAAPPDRVWEVLIGFASYPEWNPMIRRAEGELQVGKCLTVRFEPEGSKGRTFKPRLTAVEPGSEMRWLGRPRLPGLLDTDHYWLLEPVPGGTRLVHGAGVFGLLAPLAGRRMVEKARRPFEDMNRAMRDRTESTFKA